MLEVVTYDNYATAKINLRDFKFEKYDKCNVFGWTKTDTYS